MIKLDQGALQRRQGIQLAADTGHQVRIAAGFGQIEGVTDPIECGVVLVARQRFIHGQADDVVPWEIPLRAAAQLRSADVQTLLIKDGDHRLSRDADIALLLGLIDGLLEHT